MNYKGYFEWIAKEKEVAVGLYLPLLLGLFAFKRSRYLKKGYFGLIRADALGAREEGNYGKEELEGIGELEGKENLKENLEGEG